MDTWEYELEYDDGNHNHYFTNFIDENLYSQTDSEGKKILILEEIYNHQSDGTAISVDDGFIIIRGGNKNHKKITCGWELLGQIKEGFSN